MSQTNTCPQCGKNASGNFCANCGASLGGRFCNQCGAKAAPGASFCNECGATLAAGVAPTGGGGKSGGAAKSGGGAAKSGGGARVGAQAARAASGGGGNGGMGWWVAGGMFVVVIFFMVLPLLTEDEQGQTGTPAAPFAQGGAAAGAAATTDLSSMTPREAADRLYERVMRAASANDSAQVTMFLPMSIQAYGMARPLDADGFFHLSRLQRMAGQDSEALDTALDALKDNPNHLLNLYAAGDAALALGEEENARAYLSRLLQAWDREMASGNPDYQVHANMMPEVRAFAEQNVGG